jgi:hypothetical protein
VGRVRTRKTLWHRRSRRRAVAAKIGHDVRVRLAQHAPDLAVAVVEDEPALALAARGRLTLRFVPAVRRRTALS